MLTKAILSLLSLSILFGCNNSNNNMENSTNDLPMVEMFSKIKKEDLEKVPVEVEPISDVFGFLYYYDRYLEQNINSHMLAINGSMNLDAYKYANDITMQKTTMLLSYVTKHNMEDYSDEFLVDVTKLVNDGIGLLSEINLTKEENEEKIASFSKKIKEHRNLLLELSEKYDADLDPKSNIDIQIDFNYNLFNAESTNVNE